MRVSKCSFWVHLTNSLLVFGHQVIKGSSKAIKNLLWTVWVFRCHTGAAALSVVTPFIHTPRSTPNPRKFYTPEPVPHSLLHTLWIFAKAKRQILICLTLCLGDVYVRLGGFAMWFKDRPVFSKAVELLTIWGKEQEWYLKAELQRLRCSSVYSLAAETILQSISDPLCRLSVVLLLFVYVLNRGNLRMFLCT